MAQPNFIILYVDYPEASADFYRRLWDCAPVETSPTFALFVLPSGLKLGLWARHTVEPEANSVGGAELVFPVANDAAVDAACADWQTHGLPILQPPTTMDFGRTFVALDPDGHRLRVYAVADAPQ
jgi:predicted enzyme related to lactoylglutathione lyase